MDSLVLLDDHVSVNDMATADGTLLDVTLPDATPVSDVMVPAPWPSTLPASRAWGPEPGYKLARVIIHAHSVHSHDACDGQPYLDGGVNEPCVQSFRRALCDDNIDVVCLTEHSSKMAEGSFERVMQIRAGDEEIREGGRLVGYWLTCSAVQRVLVLPGAENELMPIALTQHPEAIVGGGLVETYRSSTDEAIARFRAAGGFVVISHTEAKSLERTVSMRPDGIELYNFHANIDPRIAGPLLNLDIGAELAEIYRFRTAATRHDPNWFFLGFFRENLPDLARLSALWRDGQTVVGVAGSDAHENSLPGIVADGERGDSYRRVFRWFSNALIYQGELSRASALEALRLARARVMFEAWGTPRDFSWHATVDGLAGELLADGATLSLQRGAITLTARAPQIHALPRGTVEPLVRVRILKADSAAPSGWTALALPTESTASAAVTEPGIYRAEALITPRHAIAYIPRLASWIREVPWVYSAPTRVVLGP